jgi:hypothetical protein
MRFKFPLLPTALSVIALASGLSFFPIRVSADHEIEESKELIEKSIRKTFEDFNKDDYMGFIDGWTDMGFYNKVMFGMHTDRRVPKDEIPVFFGAMKLPGPIQLLSVSNIRIVDHMRYEATAELEIQQGHVRERYGVWMIKRLALDKRYKIRKDVRLPLYPEGFPVVDVKMSEYKIDFDKTRVARNMVLKIANTGGLAHEFILFHKVMPADWEDSVARAAWEIKPGEITDVVVTDLEPGEYAMVCCLPDQDKKSHCDKGERTEFTIN